VDADGITVNPEESMIRNWAVHHDLKNSYNGFILANATRVLPMNELLPRDVPFV